MKIKIFTLAIFLLSIIKISAQPLPESQKPDTIVFNHRNKPSERLLINYSANKTKLKTIKQTWDSLSNHFKFTLDTSFTYYPDSSISGFITSDDYSANYYYNSNLKDSLRLFYFKTNIVQKNIYNSDGNITFSKYWSVVADTMQPQAEYNYFYNQNGKTQKEEIYAFLSGIKTYKSEINYEYDSLGRLTLLNRRQKFLISADTSWKWIYKSEFLHLDTDEKVDEVISYQSNANGWYVTGKSVWMYTAIENKILIYNASNDLTTQITTTFNEKGQIVDQKTENLTTQGWIINTQDVYQYRTDGAFLLHQSRLHNGGALNLETERIYGYKTPDITKSDDLYSEEKLMIFPNPTTDVIHIETKDTPILATRLYDQTGRLLQSKYSNEHHTTMLRNGLPSGSYFIQVTTTNGVVTKPIILL